MNRMRANAAAGDSKETKAEAEDARKHLEQHGNDHLPPPFQPLRTGPKLLLADREENPFVFMNIEAMGGGHRRGGGLTKHRFLGRLIFELRGDLCPVAVANFVTLITGKNGYGADGVNYHYKNCRIHRIVAGHFFQSGDLLDQKGNCSRSIYNHGGLFKDENFIFRHTGPGCLSMCNRGPDTNGSLFQVTFTANPLLDEKYVVFGTLASDESFDTLTQINTFGTAGGVPTEDVRIADCGGKSFFSLSRLLVPLSRCRHSPLLFPVPSQCATPSPRSLKRLRQRQWPRSE